MKRVISVLLMAVVGLAVSGCSRMAAGHPATQAQSSEAAFRSQANRICGEVAQRLRSLSHHAGLATTVKGVRAALLPLGQLHSPASDARAYHLLVSRLDEAAAFDSANQARLVAWGRQLNSTPPLSKQFFPRRTRLDDFLLPVLQRDFADAPDLGLKACGKTIEAAQDDLFPVPPFGR